MKEQPLVSVIMPAYNCEDYISQAIESILCQTYSNIEFLIADDGSKDDTKKIIDSYKDDRIRCFHNSVNQGNLKTSNKLFAHCQGEFITIQDADDYSDVQRIERQVKEMFADDLLGICGTGARYFFSKSPDKSVRVKVRGLTYDVIKEQMSYESQFCGASVLVRKSMVDDIGYYRVFFDGMGNADYDWHFRIVEKFKAKNIPDPLYHVRLTENSISRSNFTPEKLCSHLFVKDFAKQRERDGGDLIQKGDIRAVNRYVEQILKPFREDPSLVNRRAADVLFYNGAHLQAIEESVRAFKMSPFKLLNLKYVIGVPIKVLKVKIS